MNPVATALLLLGYGLGLPIATRFVWVVRRQHRLALWGHNLGMLIAAVGWLTRGQTFVAIGHLLWVVLANVWFGLSASPSTTR